MARLNSCGWELQDATGTIEATTVDGAAASISTTTVRSGAAALRISSLSSGVRSGHQFRFGAAQTGPVFARVYLRIATLPSGNNRIIRFTGAGVSLWVELTSTGTLRLGDEVGLIGTSSSALATGTWYRLECKYDASGAGGAHVCELWVDGLLAVGASNRTNGSIAVFEVGGNLFAEAQTAGDWFFDDLAINDNTGSYQTSFPGEGRIVHAKAAANGDANVSVTRGGTDSGADWSQLAETTPNDATDYLALTASGAVVWVKGTPSATLGLTAADSVTLVGVGARIAAAASGTCTWIPKVKRDTSGTPLTGASVGISTTAWNTHDDSTDLQQYKLYAYRDPQTGGPWAVATLDTMQLGVTTDDASPNLWVSAVWGLVEYVQGGAGAAGIKLLLEYQQVALESTPGVVRQESSAGVSPIYERVQQESDAGALLLETGGYALLLDDTSVDGLELEFAALAREDGSGDLLTEDASGYVVLEASTAAYPGTALLLETGSYLLAQADVSSTYTLTAQAVGSATFNAVWGSSPTDVFAVGDSGTIYHYDGSTWSAQTSGVTTLLTGVAGLTATNVYASGLQNPSTFDYEVLRYTGAWAVATNTGPDKMRAVWAGTATNIWVVGDDGEVMHYSGSWSNSIPNDSLDFFKAVWGTGSHVWAVGGRQGNGDIWHYNGTSWASQSSGVAVTLRGVWGASTTNIYAVGDSGTILHYDGATWSAQTSGTLNHLLAVWGNSATDLWAVGAGGTVLHSADGTHWTSLSSPTTQSLNGVWGTAAGVFAVGATGVIVAIAPPTTTVPSTAFTSTGAGIVTTLVAGTLRVAPERLKGALTGKVALAGTMRVVPERLTSALTGKVALQKTIRVAPERLTGVLTGKVALQKTIRVVPQRLTGALTGKVAAQGTLRVAPERLTGFCTPVNYVTGTVVVAPERLLGAALTGKIALVGVVAAAPTRLLGAALPSALAVQGTLRIAPQRLTGALIERIPLAGQVLVAPERLTGVLETIVFVHGTIAVVPERQLGAALTGTVALRSTVAVVPTRLRGAALGGKVAVAGTLRVAPERLAGALTGKVSAQGTLRVVPQRLTGGLHTIMPVQGVLAAVPTRQLGALTGKVAVVSTLRVASERLLGAALPTKLAVQGTLSGWERLQGALTSTVIVQGTLRVVSQRLTGQAQLPVAGTIASLPLVQSAHLRFVGDVDYIGTVLAGPAVLQAQLEIEFPVAEIIGPTARLSGLLTTPFPAFAGRLRVSLARLTGRLTARVAVGGQVAVLGPRLQGDLGHAVLPPKLIRLINVTVTQAFVADCVLGQATVQHVNLAQAVGRRVLVHQ